MKVKRVKFIIDGDDAHFNHLYKLLNSTENVLEYRDEIVKTIAKIVNETDKTLFTQLGQSKENITFFVSITDDDEAEELENQSVSQMTQSNLANDFLKHYDS